MVGMGALLGGINTIPITAILIIFEMTQEYSFILPLMLAVIISTTFTRLILKSSAQVQYLEEQGYQISEGKETNILKSILIKDLKLNPLKSIPEKTKLPEVLEKMIQNPGNSIYTINEGNQITGLITEVELRPIMTEYENIKDVLVASDIANPHIIFVNVNDNLDHVLRLFSKIDADTIPVINHGKETTILGAITRQEILSIYNKETLKLSLADSLSSEIKTIGDIGSSSVATGYSIAELNINYELIGQSLSDLKMRSRFGLEVLMIKHPQEIFDNDDEKEIIVSADPNYKLKRGDKLVVFGKDENIEKFRNS
jgi:chloride channel protein, CIC family